MRRSRDEVLRCDAQIRAERVERITPRDDGWFDVTSPSGTVATRTVVLATGVLNEVPAVSGAPMAWGRDLRGARGLTVAPLNAVTLHQAPEGQLGAASSVNQTMQQLGGALGLRGRRDALQPARVGAP